MTCQEADSSWIYFRGVVFNDIGDKGVQLSLQADSSGKDHAPVLRLFALVTNSREKSVSDFGTPEGLRLYINGNRQADIRLTDRYGNPACASVTLADKGRNSAACFLIRTVFPSMFPLRGTTRSCPMN